MGVSGCVFTAEALRTQEEDAEENQQTQKCFLSGNPFASG
jgi:hypothetical protein